MATYTTAQRDFDVRMASQTHLPILITAKSRECRRRYARLIHEGGGNGEQLPFVLFEVDGVGGMDRFAAMPGVTGGSPRMIQSFLDAAGGSLYIDDLASLTQGEQAELFALLQSQRPPKWPAHAQSLAVRIIAGASRHLDRERASGAFCEPLFYRLNIIHFDLLDAALDRVPVMPGDRMTTPAQTTRQRCDPCQSSTAGA